jgi:ABC-type branched-subunit amino acid transport system substrate-binding protein
LVGAAAVALLLAAGCGSSDDSSKPSGETKDTTETTASAAPVRGVEGNVIKVGGVVDNLSFSGADDGFKARIERANKDKELGKYTIEYLGSTDAASQPDKTVSIAQDLVGRQKVFAVAPVISSGAQAGFAQYLAAQKTPYFGAGFTASFCKPNIYGFSALGCAVNGDYVSTVGVTSLAKALGKSVKDLKWAFIGLDIPDGQQTVDRFAAEVKAEGGDVVYNKAALPQGGGGDLQPFISAVRATNPDVVWPLAGAEVIGFKTAMKASGYKGAIIDAALYSPGLLGIPAIADALEGTYVYASTPVLEENLAYAQAMEKDFKDNGGAKITFGGLYGYMSADVMVAMLKEAAPNFGSLVDTVSKGFTFEAAEGMNSFTWPDAYNESGTCVTILKVVNKTYTVATPSSCGKLINWKTGKAK